MNVASEEYWSVDPALVLTSQRFGFRKVVMPHVDEVFGEDIAVYTIKFPGPSVYAKQARGLYCRFLCQRNVTAPEDLDLFGAWTADNCEAIYRRSDDGKHPFVLEFSRVKSSNKTTITTKKAPGKTKSDAKQAPLAKRTRRR